MFMFWFLQTAKLQKDENTDQLIEDPEVHWGVQTKINL